MREERKKVQFWGAQECRPRSESAMHAPLLPDSLLVTRGLTVPRPSLALTLQSQEESHRVKECWREVEEVSGARRPEQIEVGRGDWVRRKAGLGMYTAGETQERPKIKTCP